MKKFFKFACVNVLVLLLAGCAGGGYDYYSGGYSVSTTSYVPYYPVQHWHHWWWHRGWYEHASAASHVHYGPPSSGPAAGHVHYGPPRGTSAASHVHYQ